MSLAAYAVRRPVATLSAILAVVLLGSVSLSRLPVSLLPDVSLPVLTIRTVYTGAAAPEVSRFVAEPIEEAIGATPGLTELRSVSRNNEVTTTARFEWGTDMRATVLSVRERLDAARSQLPERADRPTLLTSDPGERPIAVLAIRQSQTQAAKDSRAQGGGDLRSLARTATEVHARRLEQIEGVSSVAVVGAPDDEIRVELDPGKLRALDLTPEDVAAAIRAENATGAGGTIRKGQFRFSVRALTEFRNPSEILDTPIGRVGAGITLRDVGTVSLGLADPQTLTRLDGTSAIGMVVYKDAGSNTVAVTRRMTDAIAQLEKEFPGVSMTVVAAQADFVVDALSNLGQEIVAGGLLSLLVIFVFLRDWRLSLAIGVTVPLSVLMALVALQALDVSINVLSLGGLALGTGLLVDTAIVVAESVGRRREEGMSLLEAAVTGTDEVAAPLFAGTLTTVLVFGPIIFVRGLAAALFRDLSLSVVTTVAASLVLALTLMPVMIVGRRKLANAAPAPIAPPKTPSAAARTLDAWGRTLTDWYERGMRWSLSHPRSVFGMAGALLAVTVVLIYTLPKEILPRVDEGVLVAAVQLPEGTSIQATAAQVARVESAARSLGAKGIYARVGKATDEEILAGADPGSSATAQLIVPVPARADAAAFAQQLRAKLPDLAKGALAIDLAGQSEFGSLIGREGRLVRVELSAPTLVESQRWADTVRTAMQTVPSLTDVRDAFAATQPIVEVSLERARMAERDIVPQQVASALAGALGGVSASELRETDRRTPIMVRYAGLRNEELETALRTPLRGVPLAQLVQVRETRAPLEVVRVGQRPVTIIEGLVESGGTAKATTDVQARMAALTLPAGVSWQVGGADAERERTSSELTLVAVLAALLMFLVLAGEFASFTIPLVVMLTVPLAGAGAVIFLWLTGQSLNAVSLIGIVVMIGMADNEAVVKLDAIRKFREDGHSIDDAIIRGGEQRLRAIAMTSITTVTGVLPLVFGWGSGGALYQPLAAGIIGGSISALLVTFFLLPTAYAVLERRTERRTASRAIRGAARVA
ncbi:efflux RND transporter permease subunit [Gemmatimonas groenlandica]|uniref:Efflux RND transporter permease subunit n=1 Tax=Gemmatimonas groenlandica TaxID=2732249 RepID=A0A6M4IV78_9BACT|nr:efflux RND transporter permease subunit [Gemmatimonas groenlandica]QJR36091.1 efflux RND transporter permease subunit [Gemmatimonas groenlandica]